MKFISTQKYIVASPNKLREIARIARKMKPSEAIEKLPFIGKRAVLPLVKVIKTAISNAKQKNIELEKLEFEEIQINEGPKLKRFRAGSRGRAKPYKKRMSHIKVILTVSKSEVVNSKSEKETHENKENIKKETIIKKEKLMINNKKGKK